MKVEIFDVDHGACSLITTDTNQHVLLDCGHRSGPVNALAQMMADLTFGAAPSPSQLMVDAVLGMSRPTALGIAALLDAPSNPLMGLLSMSQAPVTASGWRPSVELADRGINTIDMLLNSNFDEDHLSDLRNIVGKIYIAQFVGNPTVSARHIRSMKPFGMGPGVAMAVDLMENQQHTFQPRHIFGVDLYCFWVKNGANRITDTNNLSLVTFVDWGDLHMIFPGDIEGPAWEILMGMNDFLARLARVNVFVASHHGRRSGYHPDVFRNGRCSPVLVVISDKAIKHGTQEGMTTLYGTVASGTMINGDYRRVLTTRKDGRIVFSMNPWGRARVDFG